MTNESSPPRTELRWTSSASNSTSNAASAAAPQPAQDDALSRFIGGTPATVFMRLLVVSLIVGALLMWLDIRPWDIFRALERLVNRLWMLGFDAVREIAEYIAAGAVIVVPVWLVLRMMNFRGAR